ncbi:odorant receptor 45b-like [Colletes gigas]|uniref:odorant receptor 45b-like n=1 Tax=Colletes gigas TaxID=935657 RepID=UPI001C9B3151|nr:odorant receptor 45b-like [Colletes gigas]
MDDIDLAVLNVLETMLMTSTYLGFLVVAKRSNELKNVIISMRKEIADQNLTENVEEKRLYFSYNNISCNISKYMSLASLFTVTLMYARPFVDLLVAFDPGNSSTMPYHLPFRAHIIFDYNSPRLYTLVYVYQFPLMYVPLLHVAEVGLIVNLTLHLCAKLSILVYRIRNIRIDSTKSFKDGIKQTVLMHLELKDNSSRIVCRKIVFYRYSETLNNNFNMMLLIELVSCGVRLGLSLYLVLIKLDVDKIATINFIIHTFVVGSFLYLYSYVGEQVVYESQQLSDAFYDIRWSDIEGNERKALIMCMMNGQKTMHITAGKFYTFSLFGFTEIVKSSMACFSMLRAGM